MTAGSISSRFATSAALLAALILIVFGVIKSGGEPDVMALLTLALVIIGTIVYTIMSKDSTPYRWAVRVALAAVFILFWLSGGVGLMGPDNDHPSDVLYVGVLAVGIIGTIIARFTPQGMARTLFVTAFAQLLVPMIALITRMHRPPMDSMPGFLGIFALNGFFAVLFVGSGLLFRYAARQQSPAAHETTKRRTV